MARRLTKEAIRKLLTKGLTGWEAGKLILQDSIESYFGRESFLTESDMAAIRSTPLEGADVRDYNMFMALCRGFHMGHILGEWTCEETCLQIILLERMLRDVDKRRTVELFESFGPHVVTRKQYEDIVAAQREKKLKLEYSLDWVIQDRFYAKAPPEAREEIDDLCIDIESAEDFASAVPEKYSDVYQQAVEEIRRLFTSGKIPAVCQKEDAKEAEPLLAQWKEGQLSAKDTVKLVDMLCVTGRQLYDCDQLPEWITYMDSYDQYILAEENERFRHVYAVLDDCPDTWLDKSGYYKGRSKPSEWITQDTELHLGLVDYDGKPKRSVPEVAAELRDRLEAAEQNIRLLMAAKAILDTAADAVEMEIPGKGGMLLGPQTRLGAFIALYNVRLEELNEEGTSQKSDETRLEKALKMLPPIDQERLKPSPESLKQLKENIMKDAQGEEWLRTKTLSLEYDDGFSFSESMRDD
jgi:hypothetical protein